MTLFVIIHDEQTGCARFAVVAFSEVVTPLDTRQTGEPVDSSAFGFALYDVTCHPTIVSFAAESVRYFDVIQGFHVRSPLSPRLAAQVTLYTNDLGCQLPFVGKYGTDERRALSDYTCNRQGFTNAPTWCKGGEHSQLVLYWYLI